MEELNGYTPPASLNLSDFQDAIGDAVVQAIGKDCTERMEKTKNRRRNLIL